MDCRGQAPSTLTLLPDTFAIYRPDHNVEIPVWALLGDFVAITRTTDDLSIVCPERHDPEGMTSESGWRALKVEGPLDFALTDILAAIINHPTPCRSGCPGLCHLY